MNQVPKDDAGHHGDPAGKFQAVNDLVLGLEDEPNLSKVGAEHVDTAKRFVTVYLDGEPRKILAGTYTTEQLIELLGVPPGYLLNVVNDDGQLETLKADQHLPVREGMKFFSQVPCGGSS